MIQNGAMGPLATNERSEGQSEDRSSDEVLNNERMKAGG
jgi:hypothetical protein